MTSDERVKIIGSLLRLIRLRAAGPPAELAVKFGVSERSIKRLIRELKSDGYKIEFWRSGNIYILDPEFKGDILVA